MGNDSEETIEGYGSLRELAPGLHVLEGEWKSSVFRRRMTVARLEGGELWIHSPIRLLGRDYAKLDRLGEVGYVVVPNAFHGSEARFYAERYPSARLLVSEGAARASSKHFRIDGVLPEAWPEALQPEIESIGVEGAPRLRESVFLHKKSRTLILTDLAFNLGAETGGVTGAFLKWNRIHGSFGPSRVFEWLFLRDRAAFARSLAAISRWDFDRIVVSHGECVSGGAKALFEGAFARFTA